MSRSSAANHREHHRESLSAGVGRSRALVTWLGVDPRGDELPLDPERTCGEVDCGRPVLSGEPLCPLHLGLVAPDELAGTPAPVRRGVLKALLVATLASGAGIGLAVAIEDPGFGWLGVGSTGALLGSVLARRTGWPLVGAILGTAGFFGTSVVACAAALVTLLALVPTLL